jgi:hypothetical protein
MSNRYDDLKRLILRKRDDFRTKMKLVKMLRREIQDKIKEAQMESVSVGFNKDTIVAIIDTDYGNALLIKEALKDSKMLKYFDIRIKPNETFPQGSIIKNEENTLPKDLNIAK